LDVRYVVYSTRLDSSFTIELHHKPDYHDAKTRSKGSRVEQVQLRRKRRGVEEEDQLSPPRTPLQIQFIIIDTFVCSSISWKMNIFL
jgi:hypothetical protein